MNRWKKNMKMTPNQSTVAVIMVIKMKMMMLNMRGKKTTTKSNKIMIMKIIMIDMMKIHWIKNMKLLNKNNMKLAEENMDILKYQISQSRLIICSLRIYSKEKRII